MAFKSFVDLVHKPLLVDMTIEEGIRLKVVYGSLEGFHAVELDSGAVYDIYVPIHVSICCLLTSWLTNSDPILSIASTESRNDHSAHHHYFAQLQRNAVASLLRQ